MRLHLTEERKGARGDEVAFEGAAVRVGRDPAACQLVYDQREWAVVSRRHAEFRDEGTRVLLADLNSTGGTLLDGLPVLSPAEVRAGSRVQFGQGGPVVVVTRLEAGDGDSNGHGAPAGRGGQDAPVRSLPFGAGHVLTVGRAEGNDLRLDGLLISNRHARFRSAGGVVTVEDLDSTNGVYVNGARVAGRRALAAGDVVQIGPFVLRADAARGVEVFDARSKTRIDVAAVTKDVPGRAGGVVRLLDGVELTILPNEFVGLLGPSGAGKSTLMDAMNGMRPATAGRVLYNGLDLYGHLDSLKQSIGYVPQDDIIHRELTVHRTLHYVARLRLSSDVSAEEMERIVAEVLDVTGLAERRDVPVSQLSGGQRKRVSIAVELITQPSVIFLDEPTSGLDPATEEKVMRLFRQIAESGRTVVLTTHAMENVRLFDKVVVLMRGRLVFYGAPAEALAHVGAESFKDLYDRLEAPVAERLARAGPEVSKDRIAEEVAEEWKRKFELTEEHRRNVALPAAERGAAVEKVAAAAAGRRAGVADGLRQWATLAARYREVLGRDRFNLLILFGQAPVIALLTYLVVGAKSPRDFPFFMLALVAVWFGTSVAAREIIRERAVYDRERMVNLGLLPYVGSKLAVLSAVVAAQCLLLFGTLKLLDLAGPATLPGALLGLPQLGLMALTGVVGVALGLLVSAVVKTSEMATSLVPLLLIPQILFSGLVGVPQGVAKYVGAAMPATWAFDGMKRLSGLDVLRGEEEGAQGPGRDEGRGLYKRVERENEQNIAAARREIEAFRADAERDAEEFGRAMETYFAESVKYQRGERETSPRKPRAPAQGPAPEVAEARKAPDDLSGFVDFLHPWGSAPVNALVLLLMFFGLTAAAVLALRSQDIA
jgi:ABC-type multidrug transport system ATPase subunit/pSer/pThr/pTyr-binding forkhead associated (FHA) protein